MAKLLNWFKTRSLFIFSLVLLIAVPLYPKFPLKGVEGTWVAIRVDDFLIGIAILAWALNQFLRKIPIRKSRIFQLFVLYWLIGLLANISAFLITDVINWRLALIHWLRRIEYMSLFFIAFDSFSQKKDFKALISGIWLTLVAVFTYGLGQKYWGWPVISTMNEEFSKGILLYLDKWTRISSTFAGHYDLAVWLVMILAITPAIIVYSKKWWQKILVFIPGLMAFHLLILTASRISFAAYLIGITFTLVFLKKHWWLFPVLGLSLFFGFQSKELNARLAASFEFIPVISQKVSQKMAFLKKPAPTPAPTLIPTPLPTEILRPGEIAPTKRPKKIRELRTWPKPEEAQAAAVRSSNIRFQVEWPRAVRAFLRNPLLGSGFSSLGLATDNDYLRMLGETGIMGASAFLLIIFHLLKEGFSIVIKKKENWILAAGFLGAMIGFISNAVFIDVFEASKIAFYFWLLMGLMYKLVKTNKKNEV